MPHDDKKERELMQALAQTMVNEFHRSYPEGTQPGDGTRIAMGYLNLLASLSAVAPSLVTRNPAPDASAPMVPTPGATIQLGGSALSSERRTEEEWRLGWIVRENEIARLKAELASARSATDDTKSFAERCLPAARVWADRAERAVLNENLPAHYKPVLVKESERATALLLEIETMLGLAEHRDA